MPKVFRDIDIEWEGQRYTLTPSNRLLRRIESEVSLTGLFNDAQAGRLSVPNLAYVVCEFLKAAKVPNIDEDGIYGDLMQDMANNDGAVVMQMVEVIALAMSPPDQDPKKPAAAPATPKASKTAARARSTA